MLLATTGVSSWAVNLQGRTALHVAAGECRDDACRLLRAAMLGEQPGRDPVRTAPRPQLTAWASTFTNLSPLCLDRPARPSGSLRHHAAGLGLLPAGEAPPAQHRAAAVQSRRQEHPAADPHGAARGLELAAAGHEDRGQDCAPRAVRVQRGGRLATRHGGPVSVCKSSVAGALMLPCFGRVFVRCPLSESLPLISAFGVLDGHGTGTMLCTPPG